MQDQFGPSNTSNNQSDSQSAVITDKPVSNLNLESSRSLSGMSSAPKKNSQSDNLIVATPRSCPDTRSPISVGVTDKIEHSNAMAPLFNDATNLMRAFESDHPRASLNTSSADAEIIALSFLLDCNKDDARRWRQFFAETLRHAANKTR